MSNLTFAKWKKESLKNQSFFAVQLADRIWDEFMLPSEEEKLWEVVAYVLAGSPICTDGRAGYSESANKLINEITKKCIAYSKIKYSKVYVAFIFVCSWISEGKNEGKEVVVPLIRIRTSDDHDVTGAYYVDHTGRVYNNWFSYLNKNTFDDSWICVPNNGKYTNGMKNFEFYDQTKRNDVLVVIDKVSIVIPFACGIGLIVFQVFRKFFPNAFLTYLIFSSILSAVYVMGRSLVTLADRFQHDKSINLFHSKKAKNCWFFIVVLALSVGLMTICKLCSIFAIFCFTGFFFKKGIPYSDFSFTNLSNGCPAISNGFYKVNQSRTDPTLLQTMNFSKALLLFFHLFILFKCECKQKDALRKIRNTLAPRDKKKFDAMLRGQQEAINPGKIKKMHGSAKFIKQMNKIKNKAQFFSDYKLIKGENLQIHKELIMHPRALMQMNENNRDKLVKLSMQVRSGAITRQQFNKEILPIQKEYRLCTEEQFREALQRIAQLENQRINQQEIFRNLSRNEQIQLDRVCREAGCNYNPDRINLGMRLAEKQGARHVTEFSAAMEYVSRILDKEVKTLRQENPQPLLPVSMKAKEYYTKQVLDKYKDSYHLENLSENFSQLRLHCDPHYEKGAIRFKNSIVAANHYDKHKYFPAYNMDNNLSPEKYFEIAREMAGDTGELKWTQDGISLYCAIQSEIYGAKLIRYDNIATGNSVIATLMEWRNDHYESVGQQIIDK